MSGTTLARNLTREVRVLRPGLVDYEDAWDWQREAASALREGSGSECLALLEHPPVYTLGRRARPEHLLTSPGELRRRGARVVEVDRGGDVTFHGPGQLVGYAILDLRARLLLPVDYVRLLEQVIIDSLLAFGIVGERVPGRPGVWAAAGKIAAIGVRVRGGVTTHGFALNVRTDLSWFDAIVPCGLPDVTVTSMAEMRITERGVPSANGGPSVDEVGDAILDAFSHRFGPLSDRASRNPLPASRPEVASAR